ncbi:MAG: hypothetical protein K9K67_00495 [Bacteriovoracaceae bacterium]|nr:hypothetical protein [Bacteriovoracaceae bacterium]
MIIKPANQKKMFIEIDTTEMTAAQIRMVKTLNSLMNHVLVTESEGEYFESAAEVMRICASLIKQANFTTDMKANNVPYAEQVLEYSIDMLQDHMSQAKVVSYDN